MRVGINLRGLRPGKIGGHENYVRELVRRLPKINPSIELVLFCTHHSASSFDDSEAEIRCLRDEAIVELDSATLRTFDVWFCPLMALEPINCPVPTVVTIPDLQHEVFPEFFPPEELEWRNHWYGASMLSADGVITFSQYARQQMLRNYPLSGPRIRVIPPAPPEPFDREPHFDHGQLTEVLDRYGLAEPFFIYPANSWTHKNHPRLFEALQLIACELGETPSLVLTGAASRPIDRWWSDLDRLGITDRVRWLGLVPRADLAALVKLARALVFPSLHEGFGLPVLEAMRCGTPVVCSAAASLPELAGGAALLVDPTDPCSIARAMSEVWANPATRERLVEAGHQRAGTYSWQESTTSTLAVLQRAALGEHTTIHVQPASDDLKVGIVSPSLNQAPFIRSAIDSILSQNDGGIDYLVMDGGSTDGTVEILRSYGERLRWISEPDGGQSSAINRGLEMVDGDILTWVNSDDGLAPGAVRAARRAFRNNPEAGLVYGRGGILDARGRFVQPFDGIEPFSFWRLVHMLDFVLQPASFFSRNAAETVGWLREDLHFAMDWDLWIRLAGAAPVVHVEEVLGYSREYPSTKTSSGGWRRIGELSSIARQHAGARWTPGMKIYALETLAQQLRRFSPAGAHDLIQRWIQRLQNLAQRRTQVHADRWLGPDAPLLVPGYWDRARLVLETRSEHPGEPYSVEVSSRGTRLAAIDIPRAGIYEISFEVPPANGRGHSEIRLRTSWVPPAPPGDSRRLVVVPLEITAESASTI